MKKKLAFLFLVIIFTGLSFSFASAQEFTAKDPGWQGIVPCGRYDGANGETDICTLCHLILGIQRIVQYGLYIVIAFAFAGIFIAGVMYVISSGDEGMITQAKGFLSATLIGFSVVLGAWIIVNTTLWIIGSDKYDSGLGIQSETWWKFSCSGVSSAPTTGTTPTPTIPASTTLGRQMCSEIDGAMCSTNNSCPTTYQVNNAVCAGGQVCCKGYGNAKPYCEAWGGKCRIASGLLGGCKDGETKNDKYGCVDLNSCCFGSSGPIEPKLEKCEDKGGICAAPMVKFEKGVCQDIFQKKGYFCSEGVCCIGDNNAMPISDYIKSKQNQTNIPISCGDGNRGLCYPREGSVVLGGCPTGYSWLTGGTDCANGARCCIKK